jgi:hypothetical protein
MWHVYRWQGSLCYESDLGRRNQGGEMATESGADVYHGAPHCLLGLFDAAAGGLADWSEFDAEAKRLSIEVRGLSREELRAIIESSTLEIPTTEHRTLHQEASDFSLVAFRSRSRQAYTLEKYSPRKLSLRGSRGSTTLLDATENSST